jgi:hypothetical protein
LAVISFGISSLPFSFIKAVIDSLASDGLVESFNQSSLQTALPEIRLFGWLCASLALGLVLLRSKTQSVLAETLDRLSWKNLTSDLRQIFGISLGERQDQLYPAALLIVTLLALLIRLVFISRPMRHDEAYTFIAFASRSLRVVISDYHLPNNHVFHTLLVYLAYHLLGNQPWIIRLPALVAGVLVVPATYWVGNRFYNRNTAIISAGLVASASSFIDYSTNARGYSLLSLFALLILALGVHVKEKNNLLAWILIVCLSALGFYTNPTMLYPFGILMTWLLVSALLKDISQVYDSRFIYYLLASGICVALLTILFYAPIVVYSGPDSLVGNTVVAPLSWEDFQQSIWVRAQNTWEDWTAGVPLFITMLLVIGTIISLVFHRRLSPHRLPLQIAAVIWIAITLILQRVAPWPRIWLFLLPLFIIWASAGLAYVLHLAARIRPSFHHGHLAILGVVILLPAFLLATFSINPPSPMQTIGVEEEITRYLKDYLQPGDEIVAVSPMRAQVGYYFSAYDIPDDFFYDHQTEFARAIVLVNEKHDQTLESVIEHEGLANVLDLDAAKLIGRFKYAAIYEISR